ncbi:hypothetical protein QWY93_10125 [Echinicola jeungdonensis]|uniref:3-oxoacyl-ACP synthase n=1 Tax=Echinicola jeungdonensis TaxID=709343 RepID=A0ABV5J7Q8_9BACT|nr:hypothetical protein [Echinicola jeungdonensis]MDN3669680.1 hypothetical protein [Echinicola jeungdonensis]
MTTIPLPKYKIHQALVHLIQEKIEEAQLQINHLKNAAAEDTKSSAGDKYETGREMVQQEITKTEKLLQDYKTQREMVKSLPLKNNSETVRKGCVVHTQKLIFYVSVSFGKFLVEGQEIFAMSEKAPLTQKMMGKSSGDQISFNGMEYKLEAVY